MLEQALAQVQADPSLLPGAIDESLRHCPSAPSSTRHTPQAMELGGARIPPGSDLFLSLAAANRDPGVWEDPASFHPSRSAKAHVSFGGGLHFCVGAPLARLELQIALPILFQRLPKLRLTTKPRYADVYHFHGLKSLMLRAD